MRRVLVVAHDPELTHLIVTILEHGGYDPVAARTAQEARATLHHDEPSAILVDLDMPHQHGWQFLHECQADPACRDIPSAAIAADDDEIYRASTLGTRGRLMKPFGMTAVLDLVDGMTGSGQSPSTLSPN